LTMSNSQMNGAVSIHNVRKVAVIGAGAAGLAVARELKKDFDVDVLEQSGDVGGVWQYTDDIEESLTSPMQESLKQKSQVHSSMYKSLRTNLPREVMQYSDFPFSSDFSPLRYPHHSAVQAYLQAFAQDQEIRQHIRFHRKVISIDSNQVLTMLRSNMRDFSRPPFLNLYPLPTPAHRSCTHCLRSGDRMEASLTTRGAGRCGIATPAGARLESTTRWRCATAITLCPTSRISRASARFRGPW
jgi:hypothetical protein